jgi:hypothetical protein
MCVITVFARYLSSSDNLAPAAGRMNNKSAENPANVIIRPANVYKRVAPLISMFCSRILCELPLQRTAVHQIPCQKSPQIIWKVFPQSKLIQSRRLASTLLFCLEAAGPNVPFPLPELFALGRKTKGSSPELSERVSRKGLT